MVRLLINFLINDLKVKNLSSFCFLILIVFYRNFTVKSRNFYVNYCFANYFLRKNYVNFFLKMVNLHKEQKKSEYFDFGKNQVKSRKFT
jgi:hypothetical protein